mgnify:FL=1
MADPEVIEDTDKHYCFDRQTAATERLGITTSLPATLSTAGRGEAREFRFHIADDTNGSDDRQVVLKLYVGGLVTADRLALSLNGRSLEEDTTLHRPADRPPYHGLWTEVVLASARPERGWNLRASSCSPVRTI